MTNENLFRKEAVDNATAKIKGVVVLNQPISHHVYTAFAVIFVVCLLIILISGHYTRKEVATGSILPDKGLIDLPASITGSVMDVYVTQGQHVKAGEPLLSLVKKDAYGTNKSYQATYLESIESEIQAIEDRQLSEIQKLDSQKELLLSRQSNLKSTISSNIKKQGVSEQRLAMTKSELIKYQGYFNRKLVVESEVVRRRDAALQAELSLESLKNELLQNENQLKQIDIELQEFPRRKEAIIATYEQEKRLIEQKRLAHNKNSLTVITSPVSGRVGFLDAHRGKNYKEGEVVSTIIPEGSLYVGEVKIPTNAIGLIQVGDSVNINYEAFPYTRYGFYKGKVSSISETLNADEYGNYYYKVLIDLEEQSIKVKEKHYKLQPGMKFTSEIILEKQSLLKWLIEPLRTLKG